MAVYYLLGGMKSAFRFRLYPDRKQSKKMSRMVEAARRLWNHALAKPIADAGWGQPVVRVPPAYPTQGCSFCGVRSQIPLSARQFECRGCGRALDRDFAARIVLKRGLAQVGQGMPEFEPAETGPLPVPTTVRASQAEEAGTMRDGDGAARQEARRWKPTSSLVGGCHVRNAVSASIAKIAS